MRLKDKRDKIHLTVEKIFERVSQEFRKKKTVNCNPSQSICDVMEYQNNGRPLGHFRNSIMCEIDNQ